MQGIPEDRKGPGATELEMWWRLGGRLVHVIVDV